MINWSDYFTYNPDEGKLYWKVTNSVRAPAGSEVSSVNSKGYVCVGLNKRDYKVHRIVWEMHNHGLQLTRYDEIDHIDHNKLNNRISNLRKVTRKQNSYNQKLRATNTSGTMGVHFSKHRKKWIAQLKVDGVVMSLGSFSDINDAIAARKSAEIKYGFHENHGK